MFRIYVMYFNQTFQVGTTSILVISQNQIYRILKFPGLALAVSETGKTLEKH